jgi:hypothetical protein
MTPHPFIYEFESLGDIYVIHEIGSKRLHLVGTPEEIEEALNLPANMGAVRSRLLEVFPTADQLSDAANVLEDQAPLPDGPGIAKMLRRVADSLDD